MRKLELKPYEVKFRNIQGQLETQPYDFKDAIINLMFHPNLGLQRVALLETDILAKKIMEADKEILLEEEEYNKINNAVERFEGFTKNEVELVKRVSECPKIDVKEKK